MDVECGSTEENEKNNKIFNQLLEQYNNLMENLGSEEREQLENALLVYNSCLYEAINQLVAIPDFRNRDPNELYTELRQNPDFSMTTDLFLRSLKYGNYFIKNGDKSFNEEIYKRLGVVKGSSKKDYIESLISIYDTITKYKDSLQLPEDVHLYRGIYSGDVNEPNNMARSELISTSLKLDVAKKFFRDSKTPILFITEAKKGTKCMIIPYKLTARPLSYVKGAQTVKYEGIDRTTALENNEVMLFSSEISLDKTNTTIIDEGIRKITVIESELEPKKEKNVQDLGKETLLEQAETPYIDDTAKALNDELTRLSTNEQIQQN